MLCSFLSIISLFIQRFCNLTPSNKLPTLWFGGSQSKWSVFDNCGISLNNQLSFSRIADSVDITVYIYIYSTDVTKSVIKIDILSLYQAFNV